MGQGPSKPPEVPRAPSTEDGGGRPVDFCRRKHRLQFEHSSEDLVEGQAVRLQRALGGLDVARLNGEAIGPVRDGRVSAIEQCMRRGFDFAGEIVSLQVATGQVEVVGEAA